MYKIFAVVLATSIFSAAPAFAADSKAGQGKAVMCQSCHGADGISSIPMYPNLKGQKAAYLAKQLTAFKEGTRKDPTMEAMSKALSSADIEDISAYYAEMK